MHALLAIVDGREILPNFLTGEAHHRGQQPDEGFADAPNGGLGGAAAERAGSSSVQAILQNVEIESAQFDRAEIIHPVVDLVKCKFLKVAPTLTRGTSLLRT